MPGLAMIEAMGKVASRENVTVPIKDSARIPVFENTLPAVC
jgi:hypothetical protein